MKESRKVREAIALLEGKMARKYGYEMFRDFISIYGIKYPITTQTYKRLIELGY